MYEALLEKDDRYLGSTQFQGALLRAGKYARLREVIRKHSSVPSPAEQSMLVAATAQEKGAAAAVDEIERSEDRETRDQARGMAVALLLGLRNYESVAALSRSVTPVPGKQDVRTYADVFARTRRFETLKRDLRDPADVVRESVLAMLGVSKVPLEELYAPSAIEDARKSGPMAKKLATVFAGRNGGHVSDAVLADLSLAGSELKVEAAPNAWRVHIVPMEVSSGVQGSWIYLTKTAKGPRIIGGNNERRRLARAALAALAAKDLPTARLWLDWARDVEAGDGETGTFKGTSFAHLWSKGKQGSADEVRVAAASLMIGEKTDAPEAIAILEPALATASSRDAIQIERSLILAYERVDRSADALRITQAQQARFPDETAPFFATVWELQKLKRHSEAKKLLLDQLSAVPDDLRSRRALAQILSGSGDFEGARKIELEIIDAGKADAGTWNELAWEELFDPTLAAKSEKDAERAVELSRASSPASLHTLASAKAEVGKLVEAKEQALRGADGRGLEEPEDSDFYVWGRIAESLELRDLAVSYYARIPRDEEPTSAWSLAQRRLGAAGNASR